MCDQGHYVIYLHDEKWSRGFSDTGLREFAASQTKNFEFQTYSSAQGERIVVSDLVRNLATVVNYMAHPEQSGFYLDRWKGYLPRGWQNRTRSRFWCLALRFANGAGILRLIDSLMVSYKAEVGIIRKIQPDFVMVCPGNMRFGRDADFIMAARLQGIRTSVPVYSWDNLTTKGLFWHKPDLLFCWNNDHQREAINFQKFKQQQTRVVGSPFFDKWFSEDGDTSAGSKAGAVSEFSKMMRGKDYVLYLGSSANIVRDESVQVERIHSLCRQRGLELVARPHPANSAPYQRLIGVDGLHVYPESGVLPESRSEVVETRDMFVGAKAVIGINTSALLDSVVLGCRTATLIVNDLKSTQSGAAHFETIRNDQAFAKLTDDEDIVAFISGDDGMFDTGETEREAFIKKFVYPGSDIGRAGSKIAEISLAYRGKTKTPKLERLVYNMRRGITLLDRLTAFRYFFKLYRVIVLGAERRRTAPFEQGISGGELDDPPAKNPPRALHIVPLSYLSSNEFHGSTKDIARVEDMIAEHTPEVILDRIAVARGKHSLINLFGSINAGRLRLQDYDFVIINLPGLNALLSITLKILCEPKTKLVYRAHNAEFPHRWDQFKITSGLDRVTCFRRAVFGWMSDRITSAVVDYVWSISRDDNYEYWSHNTKTSVTVAYPGLASGRMPTSRQDIVLSVGAAERGGVIAMEQERDFYASIQKVDLPSDMRAIQIGACIPEEAPDFVETHAFVDDPISFISRASVICVLGSAGRGSKTKVVDSVTLGVQVVMTEALFDRVDAEFKHGCVPFGENCMHADFPAALAFAIERHKKGFKLNGDKLKSAVMLNNRAAMRSTFGLAHEFGLADHESANALTERRHLLTVLYVLDNQFIANVDLVSEMNPDIDICWTVVCNHELALASAKALNKKLVEKQSNVTLNVICGIENSLNIQNSGSLNHSVGLHYGISYLVCRGVTAVTLLDPDFYIVKPDWIKSAAEMHKTGNLDLIGSVPNPAILTHNLDIPSVHFMSCNISPFRMTQMDFSPDLLKTAWYKASINAFRETMDAPTPGNGKPNFSKRWARFRYFRALVNQNKDTGHRLGRASWASSQLYMVHPVGGLKALQSIRIFRWLRFLDYKIFKRFRYLRRVTERLPFKPIVKAGEVYYETLARDELPFGFHLHNTAVEINRSKIKKIRQSADLRLAASRDEI